MQHERRGCTPASHHCRLLCCPPQPVTPPHPSACTLPPSVLYTNLEQRTAVPSPPAAHPPTHLEARHGGIPGRKALRVLRRHARRRAVCAAEHHRAGDLARRHVQVLGCRVDDLLKQPGGDGGARRCVAGGGGMPSQRFRGHALAWGPSFGAAAVRQLLPSNQQDPCTAAATAPHRHMAVARAWSMACIEKLKVMNSTMGRSPANAAPTPMPVKPACGAAGGCGEGVQGGVGACRAADSGDSSRQRLRLRLRFTIPAPHTPPPSAATHHATPPTHPPR